VALNRDLDAALAATLQLLSTTRRSLANFGSSGDLS